MSQEEIEATEECNSLIAHLESVLLLVRTNMVAEMASTDETMKAVDEVLRTQEDEAKRFKLKGFLNELNPFKHQDIEETEREYIALLKRNELTMKASISMESEHMKSLRKLLSQSSQIQELLKQVEERKAFLEG